MKLLLVNSKPVLHRPVETAAIFGNFGVPAGELGKKPTFESFRGSPNCSSSAKEEHRTRQYHGQGSGIGLKFPGG
jgi:hypothetical protein